VPRSPTNGDPYIGLQPIPDYSLTEKVGEGKIGSVYKTVRADPLDILACKVIPEEKLKKGWERELQKVVKLRTVPGVVQYHSHGTRLDRNNRPFVWVLWDFVEGPNLKQYLEAPPVQLDISFTELVTRTILEVLLACRSVGINHGDLHEGNVLISNPDPRLPGSPRRVWISDFGYGGSHNELQPKDDFRQLFSIAQTLVHKLDVSTLNASDRVMRLKIEEFCQKRVLEFDPTQGGYVGNPTLLLQDFSLIRAQADREAAAGGARQVREPGDYLVAEALGHRADEWKDLFVPRFLAAPDLLTRNIAVLTGARGCGKTMVFRRLTVFMDKVVGEPSGVEGANQFVGMYLNCRNLVEAFPWVPPKLTRAMQQQVMHYFNLAWFDEVCRTLALCDESRAEDYSWLDGFAGGLFVGRYQSLPQGADILAHVAAFLEAEKERCRLTDLGARDGLGEWPLARMDFLDVLQAQLERNVSWVGEKPLYFFLDDFTIPIVTRSIQQVLNPIIFKRRSKLFFKISTEATNSFHRSGLHGKPLELHQDFELIDLATESLHQPEKSKTDFLDKIFRPRIGRHSAFKDKQLGLKDVLGTMGRSNNELAREMRETAEAGGRKRVTYHGIQSFVGMWTSDVRTMIEMFADMLREADGELKHGVLSVSKTIQDKVYRSTGGEFLTFAESLTDPSLWERGPTSTKPGQEKYGRQLRDIAEAFIKVARFELAHGKLVSNQGRMWPKQAFRLEIIDKFDLPDKAFKYLEGLVRWHIFLQDWRGKSVRGMITPRLYLNRVLLPYANLTFSSHDNLQLLNREFARLLQRPKGFARSWQRKRALRPSSREAQRSGETRTFDWGSGRAKD
jgi:hypothetical protein